MLQRQLQYLEFCLNFNIRVRQLQYYPLLLEWKFSGTVLLQHKQVKSCHCFKNIECVMSPNKLQSKVNLNFCFAHELNRVYSCNCFYQLMCYFAIL